jgi:AcrR family transcriptional regulator
LSARASLASSKPRRRTHAERTTETRARIMSAVVESIAELGFQRSTAAEIARRAGITWGAVQHHFGGKDGILVAVLEDSFTRFAERLIDIDVDGVPLERRVALFIERASQHFASPDFRSTFEILQHYAADSASDGQKAMLGSWNRIWSRIFDDAHLSATQRASLQHFTISFLVGRASLVRFKPVPARVLDAQLELLTETLVRALRTQGATR